MTKFCGLKIFFVGTNVVWKTIRKRKDTKNSSAGTYKSTEEFAIKYMGC
jgi:hypothetical protein